jgi:hypothetical protein
VARVLKAEVSVQRILHEEPHANTADDADDSGVKKTDSNARHHHLLGGLQWAYCRDITGLYGGEVSGLHLVSGEKCTGFVHCLTCSDLLLSLSALVSTWISYARCWTRTWKRFIMI